MGWSKPTRIKVMIGIDVVFFLLELSVGFAVHSLALMADAFHMLNDIISLLVGLWAVSVAQKATTDRFSYGWVRAEILGAFFNAVFLIALCVSIVLEALARFVDPPEIKTPQLILVVGCLGLASNLAGFVILGGHGHSHGPGDHDHDHGEEHSHAHNVDGAVEEGLAGYDTHDHGHEHAHGTSAVSAAPASTNPRGHIRFENDESPRSPRSGHKRRSLGSRHSRLTSIDDIAIHPASFRQEIIAASRSQPDDESSDSSGEDENAILDGAVSAQEDTPLLREEMEGASPHAGHSHAHHVHTKRARRGSGIHHSHNHNKPRKAGKSHGHNHADMGMDAMVLHVLGDALGNVGVIITALVIWLTEWKYKLYTDPAVSLFITVIILKSAIPLTSATAKVLLQATPENIDLQEVREDIQALPGVVSCHHVHIWQLSDTKVVASMHIKVAFPITEAGGEKYMEVAKMARKCLHAYGIHSATIQPEFCLDTRHDHAEDIAMGLDGSTIIGAPKCAPAENPCLLDCIDDCVGKGCCSSSAPGSRPESSHSHSHDDHDHGHEHRH